MNYILGSGVMIQMLGKHVALPKDPSLVSKSGCSQMPIVAPRDLAPRKPMLVQHVLRLIHMNRNKSNKPLKNNYILLKSYQLKGTASNSSLVFSYCVSEVKISSLK